MGGVTDLSTRNPRGIHILVFLGVILFGGSGAYLAYRTAYTYASLVHAFLGVMILCFLNRELRPFENDRGVSRAAGWQIPMGIRFPFFAFFIGLLMTWASIQIIDLVLLLWRGFVANG